MANVDHACTRDTCAVGCANRTLCVFFNVNVGEKSSFQLPRERYGGIVRERETETETETERDRERDRDRDRDRERQRETERDRERQRETESFFFLCIYANQTSQPHLMEHDRTKLQPVHGQRDQVLDKRSLVHVGDDNQDAVVLPER